MTDLMQLNKVDLSLTTGKILNQKLVQKLMLTDISFQWHFVLALWSRVLRVSEGSDKQWGKKPPLSFPSHWSPAVASLLRQLKIR